MLFSTADCVCLWAYVCVARSVNIFNEILATEFRKANFNASIQSEGEGVATVGRLKAIIYHFFKSKIEPSDILCKPTNNTVN